MVSKNKIKNFIDCIESSYSTCWDYLNYFKSIKDTENFELAAFGICNFQLILANSLYEIQNYHIITRKEFKKLNDRRTFLSKNYFKKRSALLQKYLASLKSLIIIGKSLGDAFAWFFYQFDQNLLVDHINHPPNLHPSSGSGGLAEIAFMSKSIIIKKQYFTIYHGITNILRIGDFTIIDLKNLRVNKLVELKSEKISERCWNMQLFIFGKDKSLFGLRSSRIELDVTIKKKVYEDRLKKQIEKIKIVIGKQTTSRINPGTVNSLNYLYDLETTLKTLRTNTCKHTLLGKGLIASCYKSSRSKLSEILLKGYLLTNMNIENLHFYISEIQTDLVNLNHNLFNTIHFNSETNINFLPGTMPLFWYKIDTDVLKSIYFQRILITTVYNPAVLVKELMNIGFYFTIEGKKLIIYKNEKEGKMGIDNYMYFVDYISIYLNNEQTVIDLLKKTIEIKNNKKIKNAYIQMEVFEFAML